MSKREKTDLQQEIGSASTITSYELKYAEKCFQMQEDRSESLGRMAQNLLTTTSIVAVAFVGILQLIDRGFLITRISTIFCMAMASIFLISALFVLLFSFWRRKYEAIDPSADSQTFVQQFRNAGVKETGLKSIWKSVDVITEIYARCTESLIRKNDSIRKSLHAALVMLSGAILWISLLLLHVALAPILA